MFHFKICLIAIIAFLRWEPFAWSQEHASRNLKGLSLKKETLVRQRQDHSLGELSEAASRPEFKPAPHLANEATPTPVIRAIPRRLPKKRGPASINAGSRTLKNPCPFYFYPNPLDSEAGKLKAGTKIWLEGIDSEWMRGFIKRKSIYVPAKCIEQESETTTAEQEGQ